MESISNLNWCLKIRYLLLIPIYLIGEGLILTSMIIFTREFNSRMFVFYALQLLISVLGFWCIYPFYYKSQTEWNKAQEIKYTEGSENKDIELSRLTYIAWRNLVIVLSIFIFLLVQLALFFSGKFLQSKYHIDSYTSWGLFFLCTLFILLRLGISWLERQLHKLVTIEMLE